MLPVWALGQMDISNPQVGMEILLSYQIGDNYDYVSAPFLLSGYYTDYISARTNNRGYAYVSASFKNNINAPLDNSVSAMLRFRENGGAARNCEKLKQNIGFTDKQDFQIVPKGTAEGGSLVLGVIFLAVFISFSGGLLIYNIFYLSVVKDIQYFGRLKTMGATKRQIRRIIYRQVAKISCIGIPIGLFFGAAVSFGIVPYALNMMHATNAYAGTKISFSPLIFAGAVLFAFLTAMAAGMKPAKIAGSIPPMAALRYSTADAKKGTGKHCKAKISRMA